METLDSLEMADDSSGTSGIVKSEDGSPDRGNGHSSPPPNCAICLGRCRNKSFTDSCLHQFCFKCLLTWSRVKTECPLCKQNFKSIIHNVKSNHQYEEYRVQQPQSPPARPPAMDFNDIFNAARRFRYRTTLTLPRRDTIAIRQFLMHYPLSALMNELPRPAQRERSRVDFRRTVYRHNLWARPLPDFTGRFRDCSPEFFRYNNAQVLRLMPWLTRELFYLLNENSAHVSYVIRRILDLLPQHPIMSIEFRNALHAFLGDRTNHFLHEFHCYASTPYDIRGYDRHVQYQTDARLAADGGVAAPNLISEVLSSSDTESRDSDIVMVSSSHDAERPPPAPSAGPSRVEHPAHTPAYPQPAVIPIETISHSDSDSDSEVMVVGYIKPPHQRTPELVDLIASDSDVVVQEADEPVLPSPAPPAPAPPAPAPAAGRPESLVRIKLSLRRSESRSRSSDDDSPTYTPPRAPRRKRRARARAPSPVEKCSTTSSPFSSTEDDYDSDAASESSSSDGRRKRVVKRKPKKKSSRGSRSRARTDSRDSRRTKETKKPADCDRRTKGKSKNGKDVKSSKVDLSKIPLPPEGTLAPAVKSKSAESGPTLDGAGPSRLVDDSKRKRNTELTPTFDRAGPSGQAEDAKRKRSAGPDPTLDYVSGSKRKRNADPAPALDRAGPSNVEDQLETRARKRSAERTPLDRAHSSELAGDATHCRGRDARENKRLKSIVKVMNRDTSVGTDSSGSRAGRADSCTSGSTSRPKSKSVPDLNGPTRSRTDRDSTSSSDDNIPLGLAMSKRYGLSRTYVSDFSD